MNFLGFSSLVVHEVNLNKDRFVSERQLIKLDVNFCELIEMLQYDPTFFLMNNLTNFKHMEDQLSLNWAAEYKCNTFVLTIVYANSLWVLFFSSAGICFGRKIYIWTWCEIPFLHHLLNCCSCCCLLCLCSKKIIGWLPSSPRNIDNGCCRGSHFIC